MLTRSHRFHGYNSLDSVYRRGTTIRGPYSMLRYSENPKRTTYRVAVVVSKKVTKSAVRRNRMRRRIYEIVRKHPVSKPYDIVITIFDETVATMPAKQLEKSIIKQLNALPK